MDKWIKNGFEHRYEFSRDSGEKFVIRIEHGALLSAYVLIWQYRDGRGYWREQSLGRRFATLRQAKDHAALLGVTA
jgi:hypothetical protein